MSDSSLVVVWLRLVGLIRDRDVDVCFVLVWRTSFVCTLLYSIYAGACRSVLYSGRGATRPQTIWQALVEFTCRRMQAQCVVVPRVESLVAASHCIRMQLRAY